MPQKKRPSEAMFSKRQLMEAEKYQHNRDVIAAVLAEDQFYSLAQADTAIENFLKGKVD